MLIAERLKELRKNNNLSQEDIADVLGISATAYGYYERGRTIPSTENIIALAKYYNVTTDYLLGNSSHPKLNKRDEKDVAKKLEELEDSLENMDDLMFHGEIMDEETRELLKASLANTILVSKIKAKEKFDPTKNKKGKNKKD